MTPQQIIDGIAVESGAHAAHQVAARANLYKARQVTDEEMRFSDGVIGELAADLIAEHPDVTDWPGPSAYAHKMLPGGTRPAFGPGFNMVGPFDR
ncbi:hypothetical protein [Actinomycetospora sp. CA-053990]|uniref:hypothetical protein n=1 Tax=Actinomycetospora sp. CA-053990 TaxID=3239891 RepID=UPI003D907F88